MVWSLIPILDESSIDKMPPHSSEDWIVESPGLLDARLPSGFTGPVLTLDEDLTQPFFFLAC